MIPPFRGNGTLPQGIHWATWNEFIERYAINSHRSNLIFGLKAVLENLKQAGCQEAYIAGSFITNKSEPQDFDGCWSKFGVDPSKLDSVLLDFSNDRIAQKSKYGGEMFIAQAPANDKHLFLGFFQRDRRNQPKGIIGINLSEGFL